MTAAGIGPGVQEAIERQSSQAATKADSDEEENNIRRSTNRDKSHMPVDDTILRWENMEFFIFRIKKSSKNGKYLLKKRNVQILK